MSRNGRSSRVRQGLGIGAVGVLVATLGPAGPAGPEAGPPPPHHLEPATPPPAPHARALPGMEARLGGPAKAGEGVKIGVIDTGIYPEHPSFADKPVGSDGERYDGPAYTAPTDWKGICQAGANFPATACNNKLIGARYFVEGF